MPTVPSPSDYPTFVEFYAAYKAYRAEVDAEQAQAVLANLAAIGVRTTRCPCGYGPLDTCPIHDNN